MFTYSGLSSVSTTSNHCLDCHGLSSSQTNLPLKLYVNSLYTTLFWWPPAAELFSCDYRQPRGTLQTQGSTPTSGSGTGAELRGMEALRPTSNSQGKHLNCSFSQWTPGQCIYRMDSHNALKYMNFNIFQFYTLRIAKFLGKPQAIRKLAHLGYHDGTCRDQLLQLLLQACLGLTCLTHTGWQSGLKD